MNRRQPHPIRLDRHDRYVGRRARERASQRRARLTACVDRLTTWAARLVGVVLTGGALGFAAFTAIRAVRRGE